MESLIRPACLSQEEDYKGAVIAVSKKKAVLTGERKVIEACDQKYLQTGWGQTGTYKKTSDDLMKVSLNIVNGPTCLEEIGEDISAGKIFPSQICAGGTRGVVSELGVNHSQSILNVNAFLETFRTRAMETGKYYYFACSALARCLDFSFQWWADSNSS